MRRLSFRRSGGIVSVLGVALWLGYAVSAQTPAQKSAETKPEGAATPQLLAVNVVHVKPDMALEWEEFQKKETIPTLQKAGIRAIDVVDFDYPAHHTPFDTIDKVSGESLQVVGDVAIALIRRESR